MDRTVGFSPTATRRYQDFRFAERGSFFPFLSLLATTKFMIDTPRLMIDVRKMNTISISTHPLSLRGYLYYISYLLGGQSLSSIRPSCGRILRTSFYMISHKLLAFCYMRISFFFVL